MERGRTVVALVLTGLWLSVAAAFAGTPVPALALPCYGTSDPSAITAQNEAEVELSEIFQNLGENGTFEQEADSAALSAGTQASPRNPLLGLPHFNYLNQSGERVNPTEDGFPALGLGPVRPAITRVPVHWGCVQPSYPYPNDVFKFEDCPEMFPIKSLASAGRKISIVLRATRYGTSETAARPPKDLSTTWKEAYGYSLSYYRFIRQLLLYFNSQGISPHSLVIENEANSTEYFTGDSRPEVAMEQLVRMIKTARKAIDDLKATGQTPPNLKLYDSGLQAYSLLWCVVADYLKRGEDDAAYDFYLKFHQEADETNCITIPVLKERVAYRFANEPTHRKAQYLLEESSLYTSKTVDGINFHHYSRPETIPELVSYLKRKIAPGAQVVSNEIGFTEDSLNARDAEPNPDTTTYSRMMLQKVASFLAATPDMGIWFTLTEGNNQGSIIDESSHLIPIMARQLSRTFELFSGTMTPVDLSSSERERYDFHFADRVLSVEWLRAEAAPGIIFEPKEGCITKGDVSDTEPITAGRLLQPGFPFVTVCPNTPPASPPSAPPVISPIADLAMPDGVKLTFFVEARDPDGDEIPQISVSGSLPCGASFTDLQNGFGLFEWPKPKEDAVVTFIATDSDGASQPREVRLSIQDSDQDGMADQWECKQFRTLNKPPTEDSDKDGISNLDDFLLDLPQIGYPTGEKDGSIATARPSWQVRKSKDPQVALAVSYFFEIFKHDRDPVTGTCLPCDWSADLDLVEISRNLTPAKPARPLTWKPTNLLKEDTCYCWRGWGKNACYDENDILKASFFVNQQNHRPKITGLPRDTIILKKRGGWVDIPFEASDSDSSLNMLLYSAVEMRSNPILAKPTLARQHPDDPASLGKRFLQLCPLPGQCGDTTVKLTVKDATSLTTTRQLPIHIDCSSGVSP